MEKGPDGVDVKGKTPISQTRVNNKANWTGKKPWAEKCGV